MLCPRCHQPLEDDGESYICCADARLQWRCRDCAKVSEGFAFPYGGCPQCGGTLEHLEARHVNAAIEPIRKAFEIELGGQAYYRRAAALASDPLMQDLFDRLAAMEEGHMRTLASRYHVALPAASDKHVVELAAVFGGVERRPHDPANLLKIAAGLEQRAAGFFAACADTAPAGSPERQLYRELAAEEREHAELLAHELERWRAGKPGLLVRSDEDSSAPAAPAARREARCNAVTLLLEAHAAERIALVCGDVEMTRGQLRDAVARATGAWHARGLERGARVAVKLADGIDWVVAYLGAMAAGGVAIGVNPKIPADEWRLILAAADIRWILTEAPGDTPSGWRDRVLPLETWRAELVAAEPQPAVPMDAEEPALWVHSSGTSGKPKAVVHPHRFAFDVGRIGRERLGLSSDDRLYASSKLFFSYPLTNSVFTGLQLGAAVILDPQWPTAAGVVESVIRQRANVLFSVPSLYRNLLKEGLAGKLAQAGVRTYVSAGEALPASLRDEWKRQTGRTIFNGFGASETLVLVLVDRDDGRGLQVSPGVSIRALDAVAAPGAPGRILVRGDMVALGYWQRPDAQAEHFRDGGFAPSDLFEPSAEGGWRFAGREDSLVKVHGRWVDLIELEQRIAIACPALSEVAAVTVPDADGVDAVAVFFVTRPGSPQLEQASLYEHAKRLPPYQRPRWLHAIESLPRTPTGKLVRRRLRDLHAVLAASEVDHD